ncbi:hypothetical protein CDCA_CDCA06G1897 [Cyanidium caldarium]|uniref:Uncharacterized protein n=1 Tax=Cyanidium caldarium TaxID=2771 RepID=A0AAV9IU79_CYACA|nr:hypothetical protein CDCA_CDCA06G1897 [Cyanidium caldarium]
MGVASFFRWIVARYPKILEEAAEEQPADWSEPPATEYLWDNAYLHVDTTLPNPDGSRYDNLYLDMNGIVHPCAHPEDRPPPETEAEMFGEVFRYIDRIFALVRPRRLVYMAVDGVAPRAKINQQRTRRFRAAKEARDKEDEEEALRALWRQQGLRVPPQRPDTERFDSNVITPGTPFMERLSRALMQYVCERIRHCAGWREVSVIFSDAGVPGEGEHKIAEFIRVQRAQPSYDVHTSHVLYGLDADLIMLALATHEVHFTVLRERVVFGETANAAMNNLRQLAQRQQHGQTQTDRPDGGATASAVADASSEGAVRPRPRPYDLLHADRLREYLDAEFRSALTEEVAEPPHEPYDLERVVDDFVFLCFFVGNDFLPHLPSLDIREGAVDFLMEVYKRQQPRVGYLTDGQGGVLFDRVRALLADVAQVEDRVFQERARIEQRERARNGQRDKGAAVAAVVPQRAAPAPAAAEAPSKRRKTDVEAEAGVPNVEMVRLSRRHVKENKIRHLLEQLKQKRGRAGATDATAPERAVEVAGTSVVDVPEDAAGAKGDTATTASEVAATETTVDRTETPESTDETAPVDDDTHSAVASSDESDEVLEQLLDHYTDADGKRFEEVLRERLRQRIDTEAQGRSGGGGVDPVRFHVPGWKERYYRSKFPRWPTPVTGSDGRSRELDRLCHAYYEGLLWVFKYYYAGCPSWTWFYPYHYAPFASDLARYPFQQTDARFERGMPFTPLEQLMAVLPAASGARCLPTALYRLMVDRSSPLIDYYPTDFPVDLNGKRHAWQGVALLPFVDERRLRAAMHTALDQARNGEHAVRDDVDKQAMLARASRERAFGPALLMAHADTAVGQVLRRLQQASAGEGAAAAGYKLDGRSTGGLFGRVLHWQPDQSLRGDADWWASLQQGEAPVVAVAAWTNAKHLAHVPRLLPGVRVPRRALHVADLDGVLAGRAGWKAARFGPLGKAAAEVRQERRRMMNVAREDKTAVAWPSVPLSSGTPTANASFGYWPYGSGGVPITTSAEAPTGPYAYPARDGVGWPPSLAAYYGHAATATSLAYPPGYTPAYGDGRGGASYPPPPYATPSSAVYPPTSMAPPFASPPAAHPYSYAAHPGAAPWWPSTTTTTSASLPEAPNSSPKGRRKRKRH